MNTSNVKQIIQELSRQNFNAYPGDYAIVDGLSTDEATINAQEVANSYWDNRTSDETERDEELGIIKTDYQDWVMAEYETFVQAQIA